MDRLAEIDRKLSLLPEYLAYRIEWIIIDSGIQHLGVSKDEPRLIWTNTAELQDFDQFVSNRDFVDDFMIKLKST